MGLEVLEAEAMAARLSRVWGCHIETIEEEGVWRWRGFLSLYVNMSVYRTTEPDWTHNLYIRNEESVIVARLAFTQSHGYIRSCDYPESMYGDIDEFILVMHQWFPRFKRCCWASGCAIEATMHEKMEWIHSLGLTEQECQDWGLML